MVGGNKGIIIVARPARLPQVRLVSSLAQSLGILFLLRFSLRRTSPPPLASTFVFDYGGQAGGFPIHSFSGRGGRQEDRGKTRGKNWATGKQSPFDRKLLNRSNQSILISVIFLCRSVHSFVRFPLSVERLPL